VIRWRNIIIPIIVGIVAACLVDVTSWDELKAGLLVALSVMAAGVLVRLARGLPFTSVDHYELDEVRQLTRAVDQIMRSLRLLVLVVLTGMVALAIALPLHKALGAHLSAKGNLWLGCAISGFIGLTLAYVCSRMWQVIRGDQELTSLQSRFVVRAVERKQAKRFEDQIPRTEGTTFKSPDNYGKLVN
jgi:ABC-type amino acid transport system permease subunit